MFILLWLGQREREKNFDDKMVTRAHLVQWETTPAPPPQLQTKRIHLDQLCRTKTKLCGVTHHTGPFLLPCTYMQPPNTELPTGFLLQQPLKQKDGCSILHVQRCPDLLPWSSTTEASAQATGPQQAQCFCIVRCKIKLGSRGSLID